jgi:2-aminoethylphosphonate-pyruvate transaminase
MLVDLGSRDARFLEIVKTIRSDLLQLAGVSKVGIAHIALFNDFFCFFDWQEEGFECVLMQGSGTFTVESVLGSVVPPEGKLLVVSNGAYGKR